MAVFQLAASARAKTEAVLSALAPHSIFRKGGATSGHGLFASDPPRAPGCLPIRRSTCTIAPGWERTYVRSAPVNENPSMPPTALRRRLRPTNVGDHRNSGRLANSLRAEYSKRRFQAGSPGKGTRSGSRNQTRSIAWNDSVMSALLPKSVTSTPVLLCRPAHALWSVSKTL